MTADDPLLAPRAVNGDTDSRGTMEVRSVRGGVQAQATPHQAVPGQPVPGQPVPAQTVLGQPIPAQTVQGQVEMPGDALGGPGNGFAPAQDGSNGSEQAFRQRRSRPLAATHTAPQPTDRLAWPRWLARTAAIILPISLLAAALVWLGLRTILTAAAPETTTVTRIVLTDQVRWPFFDTVIEEVSSTARSPELVTAVEDAFPGREYVLEPSVPTAVDAIIDITVKAEDEELSRDASVLAANWVIEQHEGRRVEESRQALNPLEAERARVVEQKADEEANADDLFVARQSEDDAVAVARLDRDLQRANNAISFYDSELLRLDAAINELNGSLESLQPEVDIGSISTSSSIGGTSSLPFQAGIATFLLTAFGLFVANRELGRFGDSKHLQSVLEVPVVPWRSSQANVQLARLVRMAQDEVACQIVGFDSEVTAPSAVAVSNALASLGVASQYLRPGVVPTDPDVVYLQAAGDSQLRSDSLKGLVWCDAVLLVADSNRDTIRSLRRRLRRYNEMGIPPLAIIAVDRDRTGPRYPGSDARQ